MNKIKALVLCNVLLSLSLNLSHAAPLISEGFETYNAGALDSDYPGANQGPNGGPGSPWWSVFPPTFFVVGAETYTIPGVSTNLVSPHGGTNMVRGDISGNASDTIYYNLAYRLNATNGFSGNLILDWWFYDPVGTNVNAGNGVFPSQYQDTISLIAYTNIPPTNADYYPDPAPAGGPGSPIEALSLGAASLQGAGYIATNYQAQVFNATGGYNSDGWFNLTNNIRSAGWHHARIAVSAPATNNTAPVAFYIDDMTNAAFTNITAVTNGFNTIEMDASYGSFTGYFDDLTFDAPVPPTSLRIIASGGEAIVTWPGLEWTLQSSTNLAGTNFVDVPSATSPYTNIITSTPLFFRLRQ
jgi:hypothetical protein